MVLGLARRGELQTLQSLGLSPRHCRRLLVWQGAGLGLLTALLALPVGYGLAWVLIEVVNPAPSAGGWPSRPPPCTPSRRSCSPPSVARSPPGTPQGE